MKVCIIVERSYPYIISGVSIWLHNLITNMPDVDFYIQTIVADKSQSVEFIFDLPENVLEVREICLSEEDYVGKAKNKLQGLLHIDKKNSIRRAKLDKKLLRSLVFSEEIKWEEIFDYFNHNTVSVNEILMGEDFYNVVKEYYSIHYNRIIFIDFLQTMRTMYLPLFVVLKNKPVKADIYHCITSGYSGILGSMASYIHQTPLLVTELGTYAREREEEIIRSNLIKGIYKDIWIHQYYKYSLCTYNFANKVISPCEASRRLQLEIGCPEMKAHVIPHGINIEQISQIPGKEEDDPYINVGSVIRVTPIQDVKTMLHAFYYAKLQVPRLKLWIMGSLSEQPEYVRECIDTADSLGIIEDVVFTGAVDFYNYLGKMDIYILTSLTSYQSLVILRALAAKLPCIITNVGIFPEIIHGEYDDYGDAGIVVPVMSVPKLTEAIVKLANDEYSRKEMGLIGYRRVKKYYNEKDTIRSYRGLYEELEGNLKKA